MGNTSQPKPMRKEQTYYGYSITTMKLYQETYHKFKYRLWHAITRKPPEYDLVLATMQPIITGAITRDNEQNFLELQVSCHFGLNTTSGRTLPGDRWFLTSFEAIIIRLNSDGALNHATHEPNDEEDTITLNVSHSNELGLSSTMGISNNGTMPGATLNVAPSFKHTSGTSGTIKHKYFSTTYELFKDTKYHFPKVHNSNGQRIEFPDYVGLHRWVVELTAYKKGFLPNIKAPHTDIFKKINWSQVPAECLGHKLKTFKVTYNISDPNLKKCKFAVLLRNSGRKNKTSKVYQMCKWVEFHIEWSFDKNPFVSIVPCNPAEWSWEKQGKDYQGNTYEGDVSGSILNGWKVVDFSRS
jgi:hypothetical protein